MIMLSLQIIIPIRHPLHTRHQIPPLNLRLQTLRQQNFLLRPIPSRKVYRHKHNPHISRPIRHPSMPEPQIPQYQRPLWYDWLYRRTDLPPPLQDILRYHTPTLLHKGLPARI